MSWLELLEFVQALPEDSATKAALRGHGNRRWNEQHYMLARLINQLGLLINVQWAAGQIEGKAPDLPPLILPGEEPDPEAAAARSEQVADLAKYRPAPPEAPQVDLRELEAALRARKGRET